MSEAFKECLQIEQANELSEQIFSVNPQKRKCLDRLINLKSPTLLSENTIPYMTTQVYSKMAVKFLTLYGSKLLKLIVQQTRRGTVNHEILTLHLDCGIWSILPNDSVPKDFMAEPLHQSEERLNVIDRSFILLLDDFDKLAVHFSEADRDTETIAFLFHLGKLIPSLLVE